MSNCGPNSKTQVEEPLARLALEAQKNRPGSPQRRLALTRLSQALMQPGQISHPPTTFPAQIATEIYQEALQNLLIHICQKIDQYDPQKGSILTWVNFLMKKRFFPEAIADIIGSIQEKKVKIELNNQLKNSDTLETSLSEQLRNYLEKDPDHLFQTATMKKRPHVTFQAIILGRLNGKKWRELSQEFDVPISALNSFYLSKLSEFKPQIKLYLNH